jgi:DNA-binding NarL/FixJ family response regulator
MPRVYLIYHNRMFRDAIRAILATRLEIELVGMSNSPEQISADVTTLLPDVILLEETQDGPTVGDVCAFLANPLTLRLITLRLDANGMHVWSQTWRQTVETQDLVEAIVMAEESRSGESEP